MGKQIQKQGKVRIGGLTGGRKEEIEGEEDIEESKVPHHAIDPRGQYHATEVIIFLGRGC